MHCGLEIRDAWMDTGSQGYVSSYLRRFDMKPGKMLNAPILLSSLILKRTGCPILTKDSGILMFLLIFFCLGNQLEFRFI